MERAKSKRATKHKAKSNVCDILLYSIIQDEKVSFLFIDDFSYKQHLEKACKTLNEFILESNNSIDQLIFCHVQVTFKYCMYINKPLLTMINTLHREVQFRCAMAEHVLTLWTADCPCYLFQEQSSLHIEHRWQLLSDKKYYVHIWLNDSNAC